ncbi:MAG: ribokinase [Anaerolineae bacterium]|nr:ribokinase [Anaerolineae bacterium]
MHQRSNKPSIAVVGSLNMDMVVRALRRPAKGETLLGTGFGLFIGGKGNNQAIAAARSGGQVTMIGRVGTDSFGDALRGTLAREGIDARYVRRDPGHGTGVALIVVDAEGDNSIIVVPQANRALTVDDVDEAADAIAVCDVLLLQLEIPLEIAARAAFVARQAGRTVILNPAPAQPVPRDLLAAVDILVPNEGEIAALTGHKPDGVPAALEAARSLRVTYADLKTVIVTLGEHGALVISPEGETHVPAYRVKAVDTTAAGDAFCGALAVALGRGEPLLEAVRYGNAAGALSVTVAGAEPSLPRAEAIESLRAMGHL